MSSPEALPSNSGYHPALGPPGTPWGPSGDPPGDPLGTPWDPALLGVKPRKEPDMPIGWRENGRNTRLFLVANAKKMGWLLISIKNPIIGCNM